MQKDLNNKQMEKTNKDQIICLDEEEGEDVDDSDSSNMEEEEDNEVDKPSISKNMKPDNQSGLGMSNQNGNKNGQDSANNKKKKQRSTNKVSIEELSKQIKQNQSKRSNENDSSTVKGQFDWVNYNTSETRTLNYISDYLKKNEEMTLDYVKLDLVEFEDVNIVQHHSQVSSITDDLYKRILRYGQIENISRIAKKSGAIKKGDQGEGQNVNFRDELYYDQNDPFIDDDEYTNAPKGVYSQRMQLAEVFIDDFRSFDGDLKDFVKGEIYKSRVEIMQNLERKNVIQDETDNQNKKKKRPPTQGQNSTSSNNLTFQNPTNTLSAAIQSATAILNSKTAAIKKPINDVEKDLNISESIKTQEKKKIKKDVPTILSSQSQNNQATTHLLGTNNVIGNSSLSNVNQSQNTAAAAAAANLMLGTELNASQAQQLNQLLQQSSQNAGNNLLQNAQQALQLDYLKQSQQQLAGSQYLMQPFFNSGLMMPNYFDAQSLLLNSLDISQNMMLYPTTQNNIPQANNFMYPTPQSYNLTNTNNMVKAPVVDNKDKKKKKKPINQMSNQSNSNSSGSSNKDALNKKSQQMNLIEIEDDDDNDAPSQNNNSSHTKNAMEQEK